MTFGEHYHTIREDDYWICAMVKVLPPTNTPQVFNRLSIFLPQPISKIRYKITYNRDNLQLSLDRSLLVIDRKGDWVSLHPALLQNKQNPFYWLHYTLAINTWHIWTAMKCKQFTLLYCRCSRKANSLNLWSLSMSWGRILPNIRRYWGSHLLIWVDALRFDKKMPPVVDITVDESVI